MVDPFVPLAWVSDQWAGQKGVVQDHDRCDRERCHFSFICAEHLGIPGSKRRKFPRGGLFYFHQRGQPEDPVCFSV